MVDYNGHIIRRNRMNLANSCSGFIGTEPSFLISRLCMLGSLSLKQADASQNGITYRQRAANPTPGSCVRPILFLGSLSSVFEIPYPSPRVWIVKLGNFKRSSLTPLWGVFFAAKSGCRKPCCRRRRGPNITTCTVDRARVPFWSGLT